MSVLPFARNRPAGPVICLEVVVDTQAVEVSRGSCLLVRGIDVQIGTWRQVVVVAERNLLGLGDGWAVQDIVRIF
jgi:hypothetical protein